MLTSHWQGAQELGELCPQETEIQGGGRSIEQ